MAAPIVTPRALQYCYRKRKSCHSEQSRGILCVSAFLDQKIPPLATLGRDDTEVIFSRYNMQHSHNGELSGIYFAQPMQ